MSHVGSFCNKRFCLCSLSVGWSFIMDHRKICFILWRRGKIRGITDRCLCSYSGQFSWLTFQVLSLQRFLTQKWMIANTGKRNGMLLLQEIKLSSSYLALFDSGKRFDSIPKLLHAQVWCLNCCIGSIPQLYSLKSCNLWTFPKLLSPLSSDVSLPSQWTF